MMTPSPELAALVSEVWGSYWQITIEAKAEVERWRALALDHPNDPKVSQQHLMWSRHYASLLIELQRRASQWVRTAEPDDPFEAFHRRRHGATDDPAA